MIKTKVAFLEGRLLSSQSDQSEKFSKSTDWLQKKAGPPKSHFFFDRVNGLIKKKNIRTEKRLLENIYWLTSKYK